MRSQLTIDGTRVFDAGRVAKANALTKPNQIAHGSAINKVIGWAFRESKNEFSNERAAFHCRGRRHLRGHGAGRDAQPQSHLQGPSRLRRRARRGSSGRPRATCSMQSANWTQKKWRISFLMASANSRGLRMQQGPHRRGWCRAVTHGRRSAWSTPCSNMQPSIRGSAFPSCFTRKDCMATRPWAPLVSRRPSRSPRVGIRSSCARSTR
jgi:hypothetical protein